MKSIKSKILIVVISGLLVITAVVSTIAVNMTHEILHKDTDRILKNVTQKEAAYINDILGDIKKSASIMAHYTTAEIGSIKQLSDKEFLENYLKKNKSMFKEIALNTNGIEGFFMRLNPEYSSNTTGFYNMIDQNQKIKELPITDLSKYSVNDTVNVGWYYTAVKTGEPIWLDPYVFPGYETELISYTIPIYLDSKLLGVIGFDMNFSYLLEKIDKISVYESGCAVLLSQDGNTQYNSVKESENNQPHTKATATLLNGMKLELRADYKDIQRDMHPMLRKIVVAFLAVLIVAVLYTIFVTHRIIRPLKQLTAVAHELSTGKSDVSLNILVDSKDEVGTLAKVLKGTYEKIQEYTSYINALAYKDSLTGIKNSTAYTEATTEINKEINYNNLQYGVLVADINNLKQTNDKFGHDIGNELIIHTSKILTSTFESSTVFRIGGDEFVVILKGKDYENYRERLSKLDEKCSEDFVTVCENKIPVSLARGISLFNPEVDKVFEDVFAKADHAMYLHKTEMKAALV